MYTDGISSNYTFHTHKDDKNRIWIGTQNGITLINGLEMKKFGSEHGLPATDIIYKSIGKISMLQLPIKKYKMNDNENLKKQKSFKEIKFIQWKILMGNYLYLPI